MPQPSTPGDWLTAEQYAAALGIGARNARLALSRAYHHGRPHRGRKLTVRRVWSPSGRGGAAGWTFLVSADCLADLAPAAPEPPPADEPPPNPRVTFCMDVIRPALAHPPGSAARGEAIRTAARAVRIHPNGRRAPVPERTIFHWIAGYEKHGIGAFLRRTGPPRRHQCRITRRWEKAVTFDPDTRAGIVQEIEDYTRSLWRSTLISGWQQIVRMASVRLARLTVEAGYTGPDRKRICKLSRRYVERHRHYRLVAMYEQDRKQYEDKIRPRIMRTREGRHPMQIVVCDVRHSDTLMKRPDGSTFTPKAIAFEDWATNRTFQYPVFLAKGEGVRQSHIVEAFIAMVLHPQWGMPQVLYLDNGGEYRAIDLVAELLRRVTTVRLLNDDPGFAEDLAERRNSIARAQPHNAPAKSIEPGFARFQKVESTMPGFIGGDRMKKKTANVGRAPETYPGSQDDFRKDIQLRLDYLETSPLECFGNRTPREIYTEACEAGWRPVTMTRGALLARFAKTKPCTVRQGRFKYKKRPYTDDALYGLPPTADVWLRIPIIGLDWGIPVMTRNAEGEEELLCVATEDRPFDILDTAGAKEASRRRGIANRAVKALRDDTDKVDMREAMAECIADHAPAPTPDALGPMRDSPAIEKAGRALERDPLERQSETDRQDEISRERARRARRAILEKVEATRSQRAAS